jgi:hypothetical protein
MSQDEEIAPFVAKFLVCVALALALAARTIRRIVATPPGERE